MTYDVNHLQIKYMLNLQKIKVPENDCARKKLLKHKKILMCLFLLYKNIHL